MNALLRGVSYELKTYRRRRWKIGFYRPNTTGTRFKPMEIAAPCTV